MCKCCFTKRAIPDSVKGYHIRKERLYKCLGVNKLVKLLTENCALVCDMCHHNLYGDIYTNSNDGDSNDEDSNDDNRYDICMDCAIKSPIVIIEKHLQKKSVGGGNEMYELLGFGNLADWIPIYTTVYPSKEELFDYITTEQFEIVGFKYEPSVYESGCKYILYNVNKDSANYQKLAITAFDDHGRNGFYKITSVSTLLELKEDIVKCYSKVMCEAVVNEETEYNNLISIYMVAMGFKSHFG